MAIAPLGNARLLRKAGFRRVAELDWCQETAATPSIAVRATPAVEGRRIYFAGDTAYAPIFRDIRERLGAPDVSLIPIGAYEPRWFMRSVHTNPAEAVQAHMELESRESIAMHFGTFQLTTEGIDEPLRALERARQERRLSALVTRLPVVSNRYCS